MHLHCSLGLTPSNKSDVSYYVILYLFEFQKLTETKKILASSRPQLASVNFGTRCIYRDKGAFNPWRTCSKLCIEKKYFVYSIPEVLV